MYVAEILTTLFWGNVAIGIWRHWKTREET